MVFDVGGGYVGDGAAEGEEGGVDGGSEGRGGEYG